MKTPMSDTSMNDMNDNSMSTDDLLPRDDLATDTIDLSDEPEPIVSDAIHMPPEEEAKFKHTAIVGPPSPSGKG